MVRAKALADEMMAAYGERHRWKPGRADLPWTYVHETDDNGPRIHVETLELET